MENSKICDLMVRHGIKPTSNRILVGRALAESSRPMSLSEIEQSLDTVDKSGIFRSLTLFKEHHMVHVIEDGGDGVKYELCLSESHCEEGEEEDDDLHVHFHCEKCGHTFCLYDTPIPQVELPEGFSKTSANYIIKGICPQCS